MTAAMPRPGEAPAHRLQPAWHYHFLGIGGVGMSALAALLHGRGVRVSGSDAQGGAALEALAALGIPVHVGHREAALEGVDAVVYSTAVQGAHPIWQAVAQRGLHTVHRAGLLGALAAERRTVAVAGTHGKTTCTAALAHALATLGWEPTALVGGHVPDWAGRNYRAGTGPWLVTEADESDGSFLQLAPEAVLLTNVEEDHLDFHGSFAGLLETFRAFLARLPQRGVLAYCREDDTARALAEGLAARAEPPPQRLIGYGTGPDADVRVQVGALRADGTVLTLADADGTYDLTTHLVGRHNALNLCGVFALARALGAPGAAAASALGAFHGVARRQEFIGRAGGWLLYDDYAHHPTEVRATLECFLATHDVPVTVVFQPHLYSRTERFAAEFAAALRPAQRVYVTEVYAAREAHRPDVSGRMIVERLAGHGAAEFLPDWRALLPRLHGGEVPPGIVLSLGAGDITGLGPYLLQALS